MVDVVLDASSLLATAEAGDGSVDTVGAADVAATSHGFLGAVRVAVDGVPVEILSSIFLTRVVENKLQATTYVSDVPLQVCFSGTELSIIYLMPGSGRPSWCARMTYTRERILF